MAEPNWFAENAPDTTTADWFASQNAAPAASTSVGQPSKRNYNRSWGEAGLDLLPALGGLVGGTAGGIGGTVFGAGFGGVPGAVSGATIGGSGGEAARQLLRRSFGFDAPETWQDALTGIAQQGSLQGVNEVGGRALAGAVSSAARPLMRRAIRPTLGVTKEFGDVAETALREGLPVGKAGPIGEAFGWDARAGSEIADESRKLSAGKTSKLLRDAERGGVTFEATDVVPELRALVKRLKSAPTSDADVKAVKDMAREFLRNKRGPLTPAEFKVLKQASQAQASPVFRAERSGNVVDAGQGIKARFNKAVASGTRRSLEQSIPGLSSSEARTQALIGAQRAIQRAEQMPALKLNIPYLPKVATEAVVPGGAEAVSRAALLARDPMLLFLLGQLPRTADNGGFFAPANFQPDSTR